MQLPLRFWMVEPHISCGVPINEKVIELDIDGFLGPWLLLFSGWPMFIQLHRRLKAGLVDIDELPLICLFGGM